MDFLAEKQRLQGELKQFQAQLGQIQEAQASLTMEIFKRQGALEELDRLEASEEGEEK